MNKKQLTLIQRKADKDLNIIIIATIVFLIVYLIFKDKLTDWGRTETASIWLRFLPTMILQFGLAGLGSTIVILSRREKLREYGLNGGNVIVTILLSALVCVPALLFMLFNEEITSYLPLQGCVFARQFLSSGFPNNILVYALIILVWDFFEGFNYVVISQEINERYPSKNR